MEPYFRQTLIRNLSSGVIIALFLNLQNKDKRKKVHTEGQNKPIGIVNPTLLSFKLQQNNEKTPK